MKSFSMEEPEGARYEKALETLHTLLLSSVHTKTAKAQNDRDLILDYMAAKIKSCQYNLSVGFLDRVAKVRF